MANKIKSTKKEKINLLKKKEPPNQTTSTDKNLGKVKKSAEVEALAITWDEDLCE